MSTPEFIYLVPGKYDGERGMIWSDDPDPDSYSDPEEAVKYVRFDSIEALQAMNADLTEEIDHLQDSLIRQGKMLSAIVNITKGQPEGNTLHSTHDAVESVERLQARIAELEVALEAAALDYHLASGGDHLFYAIAALEVEKAGDNDGSL